MEHQGFAEVQRQSQEGYMKVKTYAALQYCKQQVIKRLTECLLPGWLATVKDPCFVTFIWGASFTKGKTACSFIYDLYS